MRRQLNQAIFAKIFVVDNDRVESELTDPARALIEAQVACRAAVLSTENKIANDAEASIAGNGKTSNTNHFVNGWSENYLVGLFSSHANELRRAHHHIRSDAAAESRMLSARRERKPQPHISEARADQIVEAYMAGGTVYDLAREFDCHRVTISAVLKRRGVTLRRLSPSDEQVSEMIRLYESGLSLSKVGERLGFNATTVLHRLRAAGHTSRSSYQR
ncbi:hypothetical protein [Microbacterium maritypicum]